ncbi:MAG: RNA-directed DNA polymerase [Thiohalocapsa sp.]|nr:RNA-directed DNA polymerase [Thiohalocapsa sp.]
MKRIGGLWERLIGFDNLWLAWRRARRGKARSRGAVLFELELEENLLGLQAELASGTWTPGAYRLFSIYEHKPRLIAAAPFRDRVIHHAVMNLIEPLLDARLIDDCYACRRGRGTHRAVDRYQTWARRYAYAMKLDIRRYFPSIDHRLLKECLARRIKDQAVLTLLERIIDSAPPCAEPMAPFPGDDLLTPLERPRGIPIGNLTSQFFANLLLDDFDHWVKQGLRCTGYLRYVDDMVFCANDEGRLAEWRAAVTERLAGLRLRLHATRGQVQRTADGLTLLGYRVFPKFRRLLPENGYRFGRRLRALAVRYAAGRAEWPEIDASVHAWIGHAANADTWGLRTAIFRGVVFTRG